MKHYTDPTSVREIADLVTYGITPPASKRP